MVLNFKDKESITQASRTDKAIAKVKISRSELSIEMLNVNEKKYVYEVLRERKYDQEYHIQEISKLLYIDINR